MPRLARHAASTPSLYAGRVNEKRREVAFLVRMWLPAGAEHPTGWRGSIKAIGSDRQLFVTGTRDVADFIAAYLEPVDDRK